MTFAQLLFYTLFRINTSSFPKLFVLALFRIRRLDERDVVALEHDPADLLPRPLLEVHLGRVVHHQVHELVEADDVALDARVDVLVEPAEDALPVLQEAEDQVDGLHHHLLDLLSALVTGRHGAVLLGRVLER